MTRVLSVLILFASLSVSACGVPGPQGGPDSGGWTAAHFNPTLTCIRQHESGGDGYGASNGSHFGAYQYSASLWRQQAADAGYPLSAFVLPLWAGAHGEYNVQPWIQDEVALYTLIHYGLGTGTWNECG